MKTYQTLTAAALGLMIASPCSAAWKRLSEQDFRIHPKNLARHHLEADILGSNSLDSTSNGTDLLLGSNNVDRNASVDALLTEDPTLGTPMVQGATSFVLSLKQIEILNTLNFINEGGVGKVTVSTALTQSAAAEDNWHDTGFVVFDADRRVVSLQIGGIDAKFVKVTFEMAEAGRLYSFGLFGESNIDEYALQNIDADALSAVQQVTTDARATSNQDLVDINLLAAYTGARVAYVSSGSGDPTALIDADSSTTYRFDSTDPYPTVIVDLGGAESVDRVSALYSKSDVRMAIFAMNELPEAEDWVGRTSFDEATLDAYRPQNVGTDLEKEGRIALSVPTDTARYLIFQFARSENATDNFEVNELAAFSQNFNDSHVVLADEWNAKSYAGGGKNPKESVYDEETSHRMLAYAGPLAGYSGASFLRRGSGGLSRGGQGVGRGSAEETVRIIEREVIREVTTIHNIVEERVVVVNNFINVPVPQEPAIAPRVQIVSRIAVSATTVPGIGHLYFNVGPATELPDGYIFESPFFEGTHEGGLIRPEVLETITLDGTQEGGQIFEVGVAPTIPVSDTNSGGEALPVED